MFCPKCGNKLPDNARFCDKCGNPVSGVQSDIPPKKADEQRIQPSDNETSQKQCLTASASAGETAFGSFGGDAAVVASAVLPGPAKVIGNGLRSLFTSIGSSFKDPKRLIPAFVIAAVWLVLNILQACGINPVPTRILSFLTFANGGMSGGFFGAIGGIIGKGIFAGALVSLIGLFTRKGGEKRSFKDTVKGAFGVSLGTLWPYICGIGAAMLLYLFISGGATRISFTGGVAASFLAARATLSGGFLRRLLGSFTKSKSPSHPNVSGLIRGLSVGFAASALIGLSGVNLILVITGSVLFAGGIVMMILQAAGVVKLGKGAKVQ